MSGEVVAAPVVLPIILLGAPVFLSMAVVGAGIAAGGAVVYGAGTLAADMVEKQIEKRKALELARKKEEEREIARLSAELDSLFRKNASAESPEMSADFLARNRDNIDQILLNLEQTDSSLDIEKYKKPDGSVNPSPNTPQTAIDYAVETQKAYLAFAAIAPDKATPYKTLLEEFNEKIPQFRRKLIYGEIKLNYNNALHAYSRSIWRKKKLIDLRNTLSGQRQEEYGNILQNVARDDYLLSEEEYTSLLKNYMVLFSAEMSQKQSALLAEQTVVQLKKLGYTPLGDKTQYGVQYFNTTDADYRIMARINPDDGQLSLRFVHVVASEREKAAMTTAQKRRNRDKAEQWCAKSRQLLAHLEQETGLKLEELYRKEPDEGDILVIVDPALASTGKERTRIVGEHTNART